MYTRADLKRRAKDVISASKPNVILVGAVYLLLGVVISTLSTRILGAGLTAENLTRFYEYLDTGNMEQALLYYESIMPTATERLISILLELVYSIVGAGWIIFLLNSLRGLKASFGNLLDGFAFFWRVIWLNILMGLFIFLWSLLLVVPGFIAAYRYRMALYILVDHPEMSALACIRQSKEMMIGHKAELFVLDLSFFGWTLLASIPYLGVVAQLWTVPYTGTTYAAYYQQRLSDNRIPGYDPNGPAPWEQ